MPYVGMGTKTVLKTWSFQLCGMLVCLQNLCSFLKPSLPFLEASCDVFVIEALVMPSLWVLCLWGDDDSQVFSLVLGFYLCGWCVACERVWAVSGFEVDRVDGICSEQFAFAHVEFEVVLCSRKYRARWVKSNSYDSH